LKPNSIRWDPKRIGSLALLRIALPIIPGKFKIGMLSRSNLQNNVPFRIYDPILQNPESAPEAKLASY
jgi:hypothetical protein